MLNWQRHFQTSFFEVWRNAGLPHHEHFLPAYYAMLEQRATKIEWIENSTCIDRSRLYDVYGFGVVTGKLFSKMFGLTAEQAMHSADWCGRFNLGISLFDYISDEQGAAETVASMKVFQQFSKADHFHNSSLTPSQQLLSYLAATVLTDVRKIPDNTSLEEAMQQMFAAENFISATKLSATADLGKINRALYLKSAEPFRVMAEYTARMKTAEDHALINHARIMGAALGHCYWVVDDAKDVWIDLQAGHWNIFLQLAAAEDPGIFEREHGAVAVDCLVRIWEENNTAKIISGQVINQLSAAIDDLELTEEVKQHSLGIVSASLWQWFHA